MLDSLPKVGIVVLNFNGRDCLLACLGSLRGLRYQNYFVVVVDNASQDDSLLQAKQRFPEFYFVSSPENRGFAAGMNIGMRMAFEHGADWVWLFNNDAHTDKYALTLLMAVASEEKRAGLLSPSIYSQDTGKLWFGKGRVERCHMRAIHIFPSAEEQGKTYYESEFLTGCALLISRKAVETVGVLDERFFLYYEDVDFSVRAREKGFLALVVPKARVFHEEQSQKNNTKLYYLVLSGLLFFEKHAQWWQKAYFSLYGTIRRIKNSVDIMRGKDVSAVRQAYDDFYHDH